MKLDKHIKVGFFTNPYGQKMFSVTFRTPPDSEDNYRGWNLKKVKKVAKMFYKLARRLEKV